LSHRKPSKVRKSSIFCLKLFERVSLQLSSASHEF
jgi:hypothetical protein